MDEAVQQRTTVVTEGGTAVRVDLELVLASGVLSKKTNKQTENFFFKLKYLY